jgi:metal-sulfur cluster biosynthetic enzyme
MGKESTTSDTMDSTMIRRLDSVLNRVQDSESRLSIAELGLIQKFRYSESQKRLLVFTNPLGRTKGCCSMLGAAQFSATVEKITVALENEFPDLAVEFV